MINLKRIFVGVILFAIALSCNAATPEKKEDLRVLMGLLNVSTMPDQLADLMIAQVIFQERKRNPNMSREIEEVISSVIRKAVLAKAPELFDTVEPLYNKYYTHAEIKELIKFFGSPTGKKYNTVFQPMMEEIMPIVQKWGEELGPIAAKEVSIELKRLGVE